MSYSRVPQSFMKGVFISPHNFNDPENPDHGQYVNTQMRNDLYYGILEGISNVEFQSISTGSEEWLKVNKITQCQGEVSWFGNYASIFKEKRGRTIKDSPHCEVELISCEDWQVTYHRGQKQSQSVYRVHVLQSTTDIFEAQIYPPTLYKTMKDLLLN